eukprot:6018224-Amphidinium_carterae.1
MAGGTSAWAVSSIADTTLFGGHRRAHGETPMPKLTTKWGTKTISEIHSTSKRSGHAAKQATPKWRKQIEIQNAR